MGISYFVGFLIRINLIYFFDSHFAKESLILSKVYAVIGPEFQRNCFRSPIIEAMYTALMFQKCQRIKGFLVLRTPLSFYNV